MTQLVSLSHRLALDEAIEAIEAATIEPANRAARAAQAVSNFCRQRDGLDGLKYSFNSQEYVRKLIYADPADRFSILALIWQPRQQTPIHAHQCWCAVSIYSGELIEISYDLDEQLGKGSVQERWRRARSRGDVTYDAASTGECHRIVNQTDAIAVSVHVYGVAASRVNEAVNRVVAP
ncbi:MAG: hypothetical protein ACREM6_09895 [Vulcanimicrobiaceae bacterium]